MSRDVRFGFAVALAAVLCTGGCSSSSGDGATADAGSGGSVDAPVSQPDAAPGELADFYTDAAEAICGALFRCCDGADQELYFAAFRQSELLEPWHDRLPPAAALDEPGCREVVAEMFAVTPFGDWVAASERGDVEFDGAAFGDCIAALDGAACGDDARAALFDSGCFGFAPPAGGDEQRRIFHRSARPGAACRPLRDGVGAAFFGTCDPDEAFCCYADPANPGRGCSYPFTGEGMPRGGTCKPAAAPGDACSVTPPLVICQTGSSCDSESLRCVEDSSTPLAVGDTCVDDNFNLLGDCQDSYCDFLGSSSCEPLRADGADCSAGYECQSGACNGGSCGVNTTCDGTDGGGPDAGPTGPDAGVPDPDAAPAMPDAGMSTADGESCTTAYGLLAAATASSVAGYDYSVTGTFGATNDYNPYNGASPQLPPACSYVYDADGNELVYEIELEPGDDLVLRYDVQPNSVAGGIYLLDECGATVSWPDYDGSGACGSNEYRSQGYCGALGCDPIEWTFSYPEELDGNPTSTRTFWLVVDHLAGSPTGFELDFRIDR
jgi:hypothetical protein